MNLNSYHNVSTSCCHKDLDNFGGDYICDRLQENRAQRGVRKYLEKIDRFLKNVSDGRERLGLL